MASLSAVEVEKSEIRASLTRSLSEYPLARQGYRVQCLRRRDVPVTQSGAAFGNEGTDMALIDDHKPPNTHRDGPHPAICLMAGFGVIIAAAVIVHIAFNALL